MSEDIEYWKNRALKAEKLLTVCNDTLTEQSNIASLEWERAEKAIEVKDNISIQLAAQKLQNERMVARLKEIATMMEKTILKMGIKE
jgi:hypothetical protein